MAAADLTIIQSGAWDGAATWTPSAFGIARMDAPWSTWVEVAAGPAITDVPTALGIRLSPLFTESGTLMVRAHTPSAPLLTDFSAANLPVPQASSSVSVSFAAGVPLDILIALSIATGEASPVGFRLRHAWKRDSLGHYRVGIGFLFSGVGGNVGVLGVPLTYAAGFSGAVGLTAAAGTDQAVECPRCGNPALRSALIADGVTKQLVCAECYDPPTILRPRTWPFRE